MLSELAITASAADASYDSGSDTWNSESAVLPIGYAAKSAYLQFPINLPANAIVPEAILELTPVMDYPSNPTTDAAIALLALYAGDLSVDRTDVISVGTPLAWAYHGNWVADTPGAATRVDVGALVQRMLDRGGHMPGDLLTLQISSGAAGRDVHAYDGYPEFAPRLILRSALAGGETGRLELAIENLIADSEHFREWVGAADRREALRHICWTAYDISTTDRPLVLLKPLGAGFASAPVGTLRHAVAGDAMLYFVEAVGDGVVDDDGNVLAVHQRSAGSALTDRVSAILKDIRELGETPGYLHVATTRLDEGVTFAERGDRAADKLEGVPIEAEVVAAFRFGALSGS